MNIEDLHEKILMLEFHQKLLLKMLDKSRDPFYRLIIEKSLTKKEVAFIIATCEELSMVLENQKAEGFMHFHPLYKKFSLAVAPKLQPEEVVIACESQGLFLPLMTEMKKYVHS